MLGGPHDCKTGGDGFSCCLEIIEGSLAKDICAYTHIHTYLQ